MENVQVPEVSGFDVGRLLGCGGTASVWLAREQRTGRDFALKCFHSLRGEAAGAEPITEQAVRREIRILSVLDHQHLVKAHDAVPFAADPEGGTALVMDYAPGGSLACLVASRGKLSVGETVTVLTPLAQVLDYLHSKGFTHSDVSPGNVLFTGQGKPVLSDVGTARMLGDPGSASNPGTPGFVDPAPVDAVRGLQPERDIYSTAALGWYCLTGQAPPRTADRPPLTLLVPEVPRELAAALEAGLSEDRRGRPTAAALATAVYRSAPPRPLDLAASVHPTVIPELLTRRHVPALSRAGAAAEKCKAAARRLTTAQWAGMRLPSARPSVAQRMPFRPAPHGRHPSGGKHAGGTSSGKGLRSALLLRRLLPASAVVAVAAVWWLSGAAGLPAGSAPAPESAHTQESVNAEGSVTAPRSENPAGRTAPPEAAPAPGAGRGEGGLAAAARKQARAPDPVQAVQGLAALRDLAFSRGDLELLNEVNAEGSPAAVTDERTAERLRSTGHVLTGFSSILSDLHTEEGATQTHAVVHVRSSSSAYEETDVQGTVVGTGSAGNGRQLKLVLVTVEGAWRIREILPGD